MELAIYALASIGGLTVLFVAGSFLAIAAKEYRLARETTEENGWNKGHEAAIAHICGSNYWFSEDIPTMNLIKNLGEMNVDTAREIWRKERQSRLPVIKN